VKKPPLWFTALVVIALLWNLIGLVAVLADLRLTATDIAALPPQQQAMYAARPVWSIGASVIAVVGGTLGCLGLLVRKHWALWVLYVSVVGVVIQAIGIFLIAGAASAPMVVPLILQGVVFLVAVGLVILARTAVKRAWLT